MKKNEGMLDRITRIAVGIVLLAMVFTGPQSLWGFIGLIPLLTGALGWCPIYSALNIETTSHEELKH